MNERPRIVKSRVCAFPPYDEHTPTRIFSPSATKEVAVRVLARVAMSMRKSTSYLAMPIAQRPVNSNSGRCTALTLTPDGRSQRPHSVAGHRSFRCRATFELGT